MTVYDSSALIDYLEGADAVVEYAATHAGEPARAPHLALYEVYLGAVHASEPTEFDAIDDALAWIEPVDPPGTNPGRIAAQLVDSLAAEGAELSMRDAYIAATARSLGETLATRDADFDAPAVRRELDVDLI